MPESARALERRVLEYMRDGGPELDKLLDRFPDVESLMAHLATYQPSDQGPSKSAPRRRK